ncbi:hypothetical protein LDL59_09500 [Kaistella anthropi]|nr:hypothetical protein [Kaistella anthropi]
MATTTGVELIDTIEDELLKSPELTGEWEFKLRKIEKGEYEAAQFKDELIQMVNELTRKVISEKAKIISFQNEEKELPKKEKSYSENGNHSMGRRAMSKMQIELADKRENSSRLFQF